MSHHGREGEREYTDADYEKLMSRAGTMLLLIQDIANDRIMDPGCACDSWLEKNNFECEASRRRQRERRAEQLDAQIVKLRAERAGLG